MIHQINQRLAIPMLVVATVALSLPGNAFAAESGTQLSPELEAKANKLEYEIMAACCFGGTIHDHSSETAEEQRQEIRMLLAAGKTDREVLSWFASKYGTEILAAPPMQGLAILVYVLPVAAVFIGLALYVWRIGSLQAEEPALAGESTDALVDQQAAPLASSEDEAYRRRLLRELKELEDN